MLPVMKYENHITNIIVIVLQWGKKIETAIYEIPHKLESQS